MPASLKRKRLLQMRQHPGATEMHAKIVSFRVFRWPTAFDLSLGFAGRFAGLIVVSMLVLSACSDNATGPMDVKWDRDACERCRMVLSDRYHAAQIRGGPTGEKARVYKFDDIGGAIVWLQDKAWKDDAGTELWVNDFRDGRWIDGHRATYVSGQRTPMDFGIGAQDEPAEGGMTFQQARHHALEIESRRQLEKSNKIHKK